MTSASMAEPPGPVLIETKLHVPERRPGFVARDQLVERLAGHPVRVALVVAPSGWGKTFLLTAWNASEAETRPFAWVSLDAVDDDPVRFWSYVLAALRTVVPGFGEAVLAALPNAGPGLIPIVLPRLINELALLTAPIVLVLDDYHVLQDEQLHASVAYLLRHMPPTLQVVFGARVEPALQLARLRADGELIEVSGEDLRFDDAEAAALLNGSHHLGLEADDVARLQRRTEGWPAGLQLAALSLRGHGDRSAFIRSLAGDDRSIADYLKEVIAEAPRDVREFLLRTSILERLCGPLCDAVTGERGGAGLLADAYRSNLFLVALDDRGHWFRYHGLFRELLQRELDPTLLPELHARAAAWHTRQDNVEEAIAHALAAGDHAGAIELIARNWRATFNVNPRIVGRWLESLPEAAIRAHARLCLAFGWTALFTGRLDQVEPMVALAEAAPAPGPMEDGLGNVETNVALLRGSLAYFTGDVERAHAMAGRALQAGAGVAGAEGLASMLRGLALFFRGEPEAALAPLARARSVLVGWAWGQAQVTTTGMLALIEADHGELANAERLTDEAQRVADELGLSESPVASLAATARGRVLELRGDPSAAEKAYARAAELAARARWPLDGAQALLLHTELKRERGDPATARELARAARGLIEPCADPGVLRAALDQAEIALGLTRARRESDLSDRELAVLRVLATELSQREIAAQLNVSFNTVKSHTRTVFRKLSVSSRTEAVARGRDLGLL